MNKRDFFEMQRAEQARKWLAHPDRIIENKMDAIKRASNDIKVGHSPKCSLTKCHSDCSKQQ
jgi:hypothetical protein